VNVHLDGLESIAMKMWTNVQDITHVKMELPAPTGMEGKDKYLS